jgi:adenylate cyclase
MEFHYRWEWHLRSSPERLWPFVADTNRFNRDTGVPAVVRLGDASSEPVRAGHRRLRLFRFGIALDWEEEPFEWLRPVRFGVQRRYLTGPVASMRTLVELTGTDVGGTHLVYQVWAQPRASLGWIAIPLQIGLVSRRAFDRALRQYDRVAATRPTPFAAAAGIVRLAPGGRERLAAARTTLVAQGASPELVQRLADHLERADDFDLAGFRPYGLADLWGWPRRTMLELCLLATRAGALELRWKLLCPLCRGARTSETTLSDVRSKAHCDSCHIDFTANFEQSVELTFRPNPAVREITVGEFCVGGPELTPHIVAQQRLPPGATRALTMRLEPGRYRMRALDTAGSQLLCVGDDGAPHATTRMRSDGWPEAELSASTAPVLEIANDTPTDQVFVLERQAWTDQAATAADVIALQLFRDLFAGEALRPGEQFSVGSMAIVFTDLRSSTRLYSEIGDATAFGRVVAHFDVVRAAIAAEGGAVVKTIGDAVMAVFRRPAPALRAMLAAQQALATAASRGQPLALKAGIHYGPCIAVTLNDRLDYFGTAVNLAARLEAHSSGRDVIISAAVHEDPEVAAWLAGSPAVTVAAIESRLKGFDERSFDLWRVFISSTPPAWR